MSPTLPTPPPQLPPVRPFTKNLTVTARTVGGYKHAFGHLVPGAFTCPTLFVFVAVHIHAPGRVPEIVEHFGLH